ncbi:MAG: DUF2851 family protein [Bacteroides sp.]|nr:DUF2851 family protein [Bacteroides sp.]MCM1379445.1 DUF2851 family protein [Bacteroides sp.]MCM1445306.1 DUF2851 family protein [Prevotella sp.]
MEELMQYVWHHRLWIPGEMRTNDGRPVAVIDVGQLNRDAGPDFFNAKVRIGEEMWCGNVEIHVRASDWHRHGHDRDRAYDSVILHVVQHDDCEIRTTDGRVLPQMELRCARDFSQRYAAFVNNPANTLACAAEVGTLSPVFVRDWLDNLGFERLYQKVDAINERLERSVGDWEQAAFITLARALGAGINGDAFERVAASLPLRLLHKHCDSLLSLEALLFGQTGLLGDVASGNAYVDQLRREYDFLALKFGLQPPPALTWRMSRMRPASFPHRRVATLARMVYGGFSLMQRIVDVETETQARELFRHELTGFWASRYNFSSQGSVKPIALGASTVDMLIINVVAPLMVAYGSAIGDDSMTDRAISILEHLPGEHNRYTADFQAAGVANPNAFVSQAMVQAHRNYCDVRKCLYCRLGHRLLAAKVHP